MTTVSAPDAELLTWKEAMAYLRVSDSTLRNYVNERKVRKVQLKPRGKVLFRRSELESLGKTPAR
jgi:excisionase family DNA binding protein